MSVVAELRERLAARRDLNDGTVLITPARVMTPEDSNGPLRAVFSDEDYREAARDAAQLLCAWRRVDWCYYNTRKRMMKHAHRR